MVTAILFMGTTLQQKPPQKHTMTNDDKVTLVIHGGAGTIMKMFMTDEREKEYKNKLNEVLDEGMKMLQAGKSSVDVVEHCIRMMEDSPLFNAGKGAVFNHESKQEMDASIMNGADRNAGAVAGVATIKNPISAARVVMEASKHVMMSGQGAESFAKEQGVKLVDPKYFYTERRYEQLKNAIEKEEVQLDHDSDKKQKEGKSGAIWSEESEKFGTVGAVALDKNGNLAAGTSTGGMTNKQYGRIGDSPIIGSGTYADNATCAVSCTGHGEYFMRSVVAYDLAAMIKYKKMTLQEAANHLVNKKLVDFKGSGGLIAVDTAGHVAMPFNTAGMYRGYIKADGKKEVKIYGEEEK